MLRKPALAIVITFTFLFATVTTTYAATFSLNNFFEGFKRFQLLRSLNNHPSPTKTPTPTPKVSSTPTLTPSPTPTLTPTPTQINLPSGSPSPTAVSNESIKTYLMNEVNAYRRSQGLTEVTTDPYTCDFAKIRAKEISINFNHSGFNERVNSKTLPYPSYSKITENISMNSDYKRVVPGWIASSGHAQNMHADTPFVCIEKYGKYYAYEGLRL